MRRCVIGVCLFVVVLASCCRAQSNPPGFQSVSLPVSIVMERTPVRSSLYLEAQAKPYQMSLRDFAALKPDEHEALFLRGLRAIQKKDHAAFRALCQIPPPNPAAHGQVLVGDTDQMLDLFSALYGTFEDATLLERMQVGDASLFLLEAKDALGNTNVIGFMVRPSENRLVFVPVLPGVTIGSLLVRSVSESRRDPAAYAPAQNLHLPYRYPLPLNGKSGPGTSPVYLQFAGSPVDFNVFDESASLPVADPALAFYQKACLALKRRAFDDFTGMFLAGSQERIKSEVALMKRSSGYFESQTKARYVKFVLNADPVFILFYAREPGGNWAADSLEYGYVVRDPESQGYRLANFHNEGEIDQLLQDPALFNREIFKAVPGTNVPTAAADGK